MVWEASQKGVPFLGVPGNSLKEMGFYPKEFHHQIFSSPHPRFHQGLGETCEGRCATQRRWRGAFVLEPWGFEKTEGSLLGCPAGT